MKKGINVLLALLVAVALLGSPTFATDKDIIALQNSVTLLMQQVKDLQDGMRTNNAAMSALVQQCTDAVNKLTQSIGAMQQGLNSQSSVASQQQDQATQHFQALSDNLNQLQSRMDKMEQILQAVQTAQQNIPAPVVQSAPPMSATGLTNSSNGIPQTTSSLGSNTGTSGTTLGTTAGPSDTLPPLQLFESAMNDYLANTYKLALSEFSKLIAMYPDDPHRVDAEYYLADIYFQQKEYDRTIDTAVELINNYPNSDKVPLAQLKKAEALIARAHTGDRSAAIAELRNLVAHSPESQEGRQATEILKEMNVPIKAPPGTGHF